MSSIVQTIQKRNTLLPTKQSDEPQQPGIRRRLSSLSLNLHSAATPAASWALHRSKSLSSMGQNAGSSIKSWWAWGWAWILSKKPIFAQDLEMNEEERHVIGAQNRGSVLHVFYKVKSELRKLLRSNNMSLPQTFRYDHSTNSEFRRSATVR
uniref:Uncharacterized protein n=1 Tax=Opuntia streptacantha TaxID=393608 RepID=A0A7C8Z1U4_OPUST